MGCCTVRSLAGAWRTTRTRSTFTSRPRFLPIRPDPEVWYDRAHNVVLDIGTMTGFPGLMSFLIFYGLVFVFLMRRWFRTKDTASALIATLLLAYLIQAFSSFDSVNTDGIEYLVLAYIAYLYGPEKNQLRETSKQTARATPVDRNWVIFAARRLDSAAGIQISGSETLRVKSPAEECD